MLTWIIGTICFIAYTIGVAIIVHVKSQKKKQTFNDLEIRFHKQANVFGEHGTINVTHVKDGLIEQTIRFVIVGLTTPPHLTKEVFNLIWEEAKNQGYVPHHFVTYGRENEIVNSFPVLEEEDETRKTSVPTITNGLGFGEFMIKNPSQLIQPAKTGAMSMVWDNSQQGKVK